MQAVERTAFFMAKSNEFSINYGHAISRIYDDGRKTIAVDVEGNSYRNLSASTNTTVTTGVGVLRGISLNTNGGTVTIYDSLTPSGTKIGTIAADAPEGFFPFEASFALGLTIVTGATVDATVIYRPASTVHTSSSASPSTSISPSVSNSESPSTSVSNSSSASISPSTSVSNSSSASISPSTSVSNSASSSVSRSASASASASVSASASASVSRSSSTSKSPSGSVSPSSSPSGMV